MVCCCWKENKILPLCFWPSVRWKKMHPSVYVKSCHWHGKLQQRLEMLHSSSWDVLPKVLYTQLRVLAVLLLCLNPQGGCCQWPLHISKKFLLFDAAVYCLLLGEAMQCFVAKKYELSFHKLLVCKGVISLCNCQGACAGIGIMLWERILAWTHELFRFYSPHSWIYHCTGILFNP